MDSTTVFHMTIKGFLVNPGDGEARLAEFIEDGLAEFQAAQFENPWMQEAQSEITRLLESGDQGTHTANLVGNALSDAVGRILEDTQMGGTPT